MGKWFVADALFTVLVRSDREVRKTMREHLMFALWADDLSAAREKAERLAHAKSHAFDNEQGERVDWEFDRLVEVTEMIDQKLEDGSELKSRMMDGDDIGDVIE